jgi:hypothetical protein
MQSTMRILTAAALTIASAALATSAAPASGAAFEAPRTLSDWGPGGEFLAAAPGVAAWTHPTGVRVARAGDDPVRIPGQGLVQDLDVAAGPVAGWVDSEMRLHAYAGEEEVVAGTMERIRKVAATPTALGWIGVGAGDERKLQIATRKPGGGFTAASTPAQAGRPAFGLDAAGAGGRSLLVWPAQDDGSRRIQLLEIADGRPSDARWLTAAGHDATSASVAMGPDGSAVVAWVDGMPLGRVTAVTIGADGAIGEPQALDAEAGGAPGVAVGRGGAVVVWPAGGRLKAALRAPGAAGFAAPVDLPGENVGGWTAAVTDRGETIVSWISFGSAARQGGRLSASVAPPGGTLGAPELLAEQAMTVAAGGGELTWVDGRPDGLYLFERRIRSAQLRAGATSGGGPPAPGAADRRAPRLKLRVLGVAGRRIRVQVRSDERAALRATLRRGGRTVGRAGGTLRAGRARVLRLRAPAGARRVALTVRVTDAAGNARTARRAIRLRRAP